MAITKVTPFGGAVFEWKDLLELPQALLRALMRERAHHNIEVPLYTLLTRGLNKPNPNFGLQAQMVYDAWIERGFDTTEPDLVWVKKNLELADKVRKGEKVEIGLPAPEPFTEEELAVVNKLIFQRHSIRDFLDKPIPDEYIEKILEAGRAAPIGCNLDEVRFIVIKEPDKLNSVWSDIYVQNAIVIVICYDKRIPEVVGQAKTVPHNAGFDAAAAGDHMLLMAHALGLGGVWLSKTVKSDCTPDTGELYKKEFGLPDYIEPALHIAVGWPSMQTVKSLRMPLERMIITQENKDTI